MTQTTGCPHSCNPELAAKKLFLSMSFTRVWRFLIDNDCFAGKVCICLDCGAVFGSGKRIDKHIEETGHTLTLLLRPFRIYCRKCHQFQICPEILIKYAMIGIPLRPSVILTSGFHNLGNSCYSSSIIVALSHCQAFSSAASLSFSPLCRVFAAASITSRAFNSIVHDLMPRFCTMNQEDASEFLFFLLDSLCQDPTIKRIFYGQCKQHIYCPECANYSSQTVPFSILLVSLSSQGWKGYLAKSPYMARSFGQSNIWESYPTQGSDLATTMASLIQHGSSSSLYLEDCIASLFLPNEVKCDECKSDECISFQTLEELPEVLIVQIERLGKRWFGVGKMHQYVAFPCDDVDFAPFIAPQVDCGSSKYSLTAVISHIGFMNRGHYICYAKSQGIWRLFDDDSVKEVSQEEVLSQQAYLLFYSKIQNETTQIVSRSILEMDLPWDITAPLTIFSDPSKWTGSIMNVLNEAIFDAASMEAHGNVLKDMTPEDHRNRLLWRIPWCESTINIHPEDIDHVWDFLQGSDVVPSVRIVEKGVPVASVIQEYAV